MLGIVVLQGSVPVVWPLQTYNSQDPLEAIKLHGLYSQIWAMPAGAHIYHACPQGRRRLPASWEKVSWPAGHTQTGLPTAVLIGCLAGRRSTGNLLSCTLGTPHPVQAPRKAAQ